MDYRRKTLVAIGIALLFADRLAAQGIVMQRNLSLPMAKTIADDTIGAVGSAGSTLETDDACSKAGIAKVAPLLK